MNACVPLLAIERSRCIVRKKRITSHCGNQRKTSYYESEKSRCGDVKGYGAAVVTKLLSIDSSMSEWTNSCVDIVCRRQAKLWVQVIRQLRNGVKLKASGVGESVRKPIEYELTPYEMMMDDIRSRRYKLRQVMVDGTIPPRVKKDAHAVILEFIRSRPPLRKVFTSYIYIRLLYLSKPFLSSICIFSLSPSRLCSFKRFFSLRSFIISLDRVFILQVESRCLRIENSCELDDFI